jgi:hypothetical protein
MLKEISILLKDHVYKLMSELSDETLKNESKSNLREPLFYITVLLRKALSYKESTEITEIFNLDYSFKIFNCECDLEKRLWCLTDMKKILKEISEKKPNYSLTVKSIHQWMETNEFLVSIFSKDLHAELLRQTKPIILFLIQTKKFTEVDFEIIWKSCIYKHETTERSVLDFISKLLPSFEVQLFDLIFTKIEDYFKLNDLLDNDKLNFVKEWTKISHLKFKKKNNSGLDLLWNLMTESKDLDQQLTKIALKSLKDILVLEDFEVKRKKYMKLCLDNLKDHCSVSLSISLLMTLMNTYPSFGRKKKNVIWSILDNINEKILDLYFLDLDVDYEIINPQEDLSETMKKISLKEFNEKFERKSLISKDSKFDILNIKLKFLTYILSNSSFKLTLNQIKLLWEKFYKEQETKEIFVEWFNSLLKSEVELFQDHAIESFFDEVLSNLKEWNEIEFNLFTSFFTMINKEKAMKKLWEINLQTNSEDVLKKSIRFLNNNIQENPNLHIQHSIEKIKNFLKENQLQSLVRSIDILFDYLSFFKGKVRGHGDSSGIPIFFQIHFQNQIFQISLQTEDKMESIFESVSSYLKFPLRLLKFYSSNGAKLKDKNQKLVDFIDNPIIYLEKINFNDISIQLLIRQLDYFGLNPISNILSTKYNPAAIQSKPKEKPKQSPSKTEEEDKIIQTETKEMVKEEKLEKQQEKKIVKLDEENDSNLPINILQTQENFSILFSLLDSNENIATSVWKILNFLPTNKEILNSIKDLNENTDWKNVISVDNTHKLLYQLQIIDGLSRRNTLDETFNLDQWNDNFKKFGGIQHLVGKI